MLDVFLIGPREDEDVIQVSYIKHVDQSGERFVHISLEGCGGIRKPKWHDGVLEVPVACSESCLPTIVRVHTYTVVRVSQVDFEKKAEWHN